MRSLKPCDSVKMASLGFAARFSRAGRGLLTRSELAIDMMRALSAADIGDNIKQRSGYHQWPDGASSITSLLRYR